MIESLQPRNAAQKLRVRDTAIAYRRISRKPTEAEQIHEAAEHRCLTLPLRCSFETASIENDAASGISSSC